MSHNIIYDIFNPNSEYNKQILEKVKQIHHEFVENRECYACKHCIDISDDRNTCHLCKYTNDLIPVELTCLLWEKEDD